MTHSTSFKCYATCYANTNASPWFLLPLYGTFQRTRCCGNDRSSTELLLERSAVSRCTLHVAVPTHLPAGPVVVQVHQRSGVVLLPLLGIDKGLAEAHSVLHVVAAAPPGEGPPSVLRRAFLCGITGA